MDFEETPVSEQKRKRSETPEYIKKLRGDSNAKIQRRVQNYRREWQEEPSRSSWLRPLPGKPTRSQCILCKTEFTADISVINKHANGKNHLKIVKGVGNCSIQKVFTECIDKSARKVQKEKDVKAAEIMICSYIVEHNLPFKACEHLPNLLKSAFHDSEILKAVTLGKTKAPGIIKNVINKCCIEELSSILKKVKFSVIIDESTDITAVKNLAVVVRFFDESVKSIQSRFWKLLNVFDGNDPDAAEEGATARRLFECLVRSFEEDNVPVTQIIGFGSDGCSTMFGVDIGVATRMENLLPGLILAKCICHSLDLSASKACEFLPRRCEDLTGKVYSFFKLSCKRQAQFVEFQHFFEVEPHKILALSQTRWLSLRQVVIRILEQWEPLRAFFTSKWFEERLVSAECVYKDLNDPIVKMYYFFLEWALSKIVGVNEYFQSDKVVHTHVDGKMKCLYTELLLAYMNHETVNRIKLEHIHPATNAMFLPLNQMYLGIKVMQELQKSDVLVRKQEVQDFLYRCQQFLIIICKEMKKRYDFSENNLFSKIAWLNPDVATSVCNTRPTSIEPLLKNVPRIVNSDNFNLMQVIDDQWRKLPCEEVFKGWITNSDSKSVITVDSFWHKVREVETLEGRKDYKELGQFAIDIFSLPHSSATCERVFSKVNHIKTKSRNRMFSSTLQSLLSSSEYIAQTGCDKFQPTEKMLSYMNSHNIYGTKNRTQKGLQVTIGTETSPSVDEIDSEECEIIFD